MCSVDRRGSDQRRRHDTSRRSADRVLAENSESRQIQDLVANRPEVSPDRDVVQQAPEIPPESEQPVYDQGTGSLNHRGDEHAPSIPDDAHELLLQEHQGGRHFDPRDAEDTRQIVDAELEPLDEQQRETGHQHHSDRVFDAEDVQDSMNHVNDEPADPGHYPNNVIMSGRVTISSKVATSCLHVPCIQMSRSSLVLS
ncbi:hypothetical protein QAD02_018433 [Eretmocerus hayati]|uniref:Uncharacterized protein n=1 Tax=Eretmocerus hayati TaxID=131215 RepID=A0ACC2PGR9_9HYME|nr:hypothetical protein QAD02_018433 [Eretmocerus hayati]